MAWKVMVAEIPGRATRVFMTVRPNKDLPCSLVGTSRKLSPQELAQEVGVRKILGSAEIRRGTQQFTYPAEEFLRPNGVREIDFFCSKCRKPLTARYVDMQLPAICPHCKIPIIIPDKRPDAERAAGEEMDRATYQIGQFMGCGGALLVAMVAVVIWQLFFATGPDPILTFELVARLLLVAVIALIAGFQLWKYRDRLK
jgi:hypothetical protein